MSNVNMEYEKWLKFLRISLVVEGTMLLMFNLMMGGINGLIYIFVIMNSILLFCEMSLRHTYQVSYE